MPCLVTPMGILSAGSLTMWFAGSLTKFQVSLGVGKLGLNRQTFLHTCLMYSLRILLIRKVCGWEYVCLYVCTFNITFEHLYVCLYAHHYVHICIITYVHSLVHLYIYICAIVKPLTFQIAQRL